MASKLNPDAQEFIPSSPVNSIGGFKENNHHLNLLEKDEILAQSPRKVGSSSDNPLFDLPDMDQFNKEISKCPHEFDGVYLPQSPTNYQEINLKEAMHGDEKKDESVEDTSEKMPQSTTDDQINDIIKNIPGSMQLGDATVPGENDPMNMSYHQDINDGSFSTDAHDLNSVHLLPSKEELDDTTEEDTKENGDVGDEVALKPEEDMFQSEPERSFELESEKPESELEAATVLLDFAQQKPEMEDFVVVETVPENQINVTDLDSDLTGIADQAKLSAEADVFVPNNRVETQGIDLNSLPESESTVKSLQDNDVEDSPESDQNCFVQEEVVATHDDLIGTQESVEEKSKVETPPPTPAATNNGIIDLSERLTSPEPQKLMEAVEKLAEPEAEEMTKTEKEVDSVLPAVTAGVAVAGAAVTVAAATAAAAAAAANDTPKEEPEVKKKAATKPVESSKKEEPKAKPRTTKPPLGAKASPTSATPRTTLATKTTTTAAAGKVSPVKPPSTLSTRPKSSPAASATTKSPVTSKSSPLASTRKPLTSPSTATKSPLATSAAAPKTTLASRTTPAKSPLTKPNSATTTRTSSGVATSKTTTTTAAPGVKKTTSTVTTTK
uniref:Uncharacterized protein n=1 Tax=Phlebotomus papatasi TaxID=29031 RepID=A0A1B0DI60_PHLPP